MQANSLARASVLTFLFFAAAGLFGQTGSIKGKISDARATLVGATIILDSDKTKGANSDINGDFILTNVPAGPQKLIVSYLGYGRKIVPVKVTADQVAEVSIELEPVDVLGDEVLITSQRRGQTQAINQQLSSDMIANIVSSDKIQELPDVNAAEAIGRLPGVALNRSGGEGQKVVIRGMEPKFSAITVNGVRLPSNSSTDRSVDLSLISPELLDAIEVFKSPLPDMDAETIGGTVNLRVKKAPTQAKFLAKALYGYNDLSGEFKDYKGVIQGSKRFFRDKLGVIAQGSIERFNRSGDFLSNGWRRGRTDSTGLTEILGNSLTLQDRTEIRKRMNASLSLDYQIAPQHSVTLFGIYSRTDRDQFRNREAYTPSDPSIEYEGTGLESELNLFQFTVSGDHNFKRFKVDWSASSSRSETSTPYNYTIRFSDTKNAFDNDLNQNDHPRKFFAAASPDLAETNLVRGTVIMNNAIENTKTALVNIDLPFKLGEKISANFKFGGKYFEVDRERNYDLQRENFYYLGGVFTSNAANQYSEQGYGELVYLPTNGNLIGINSFIKEDDPYMFVTEEGNEIRLNTNLDPEKVRNFYESQKDILSNDRNALVNNYDVFETITAGYAMLKVKVGNALTVIPGFRYERSDNTYGGGVSSVAGRYGVNGFYRDTTTYQKYDEFLPHLHVKFKPLDWLDFRFSYAQTLARPDYSWLAPRYRINYTSLALNAGNPNLQYTKSINYDFHVSAYQGILGLITVGAFYKDLSNTFFPWNINLVDEAMAEANGVPGFSGFGLSSYTNLDRAEVYGYEIDIQPTFPTLKSKSIILQNVDNQLDI